MAGSEQIKSLIQSFAKGDDARFFATAMQIAASEARMGHSSMANELKELIDKAKQQRSTSLSSKDNVIPISKQKRDLDELIDVFQPKIKISDMILSPSLEKALKKIISEQKKFDQLKKFDLSPRRKLLLEGPPGCGKTMTAQALAGELGLSVFIVRLDGLISKFMGESISKLRLIFDAMNDYRAVYLFDEFDSIGAHRDMTNDVGEIRRVLNSFLVNIEKDNSNSIIIAATNLPETLDKALYRRFDDIIQYPLPSTKELEAVINKYLKGHKLSEEIKIPALAKQATGMSYAEVAKACKEAIKEMIISDDHKISERIISENLGVRTIKKEKK